MTAGGCGMRSGLGRALTVICLLAGVFAMHGLTSQHDAMLAVRHTLSGQVGVAHHADSPVTVGTVGASVVPVSDADSHSEDLCLAIMTALALALAGTAVRRLMAAASNRDFSALPGLHPPNRPPWISPSLSKLCVLRI
ncbi:DUF6153 family protein [Kribbella sindirgiensis]|uniref:DUF6153 family protein n=1 Tax=Kribbella sindirgiensis TaxID=1124744 RepID=UPI0013F42AD8|nr:DUF6153 family protein [Kribbella sindirgiensis]